jgi:hypothetical protein
MNGHEWLALWYLRLNGYFTTCGIRKPKRAGCYTKYPEARHRSRAVYLSACLQRVRPCLRRKWRRHFRTQMPSASTWCARPRILTKQLGTDLGQIAAEYRVKPRSGTQNQAKRIKNIGYWLLLRDQRNQSVSVLVSAIYGARLGIVGSNHPRSSSAKKSQNVSSPVLRS